MLQYNSYCNSFKLYGNKEAILGTLITIIIITIIIIIIIIIIIKKGLQCHPISPKTSTLPQPHNTNP